MAFAWKAAGLTYVHPSFLNLAKSPVYFYDTMRMLQEISTFDFSFSIAFTIHACIGHCVF